jgi:hypothetical protein
MDVALDKYPGEAPCVDIPIEPIENCAVLLSPVNTRPIAVAFVITTYRLHASPPPLPDGDASRTGGLQPISIPLLMIEAVASSSDGIYHTLTVQTKHVWAFTFGFRTEQQSHSAAKALSVLMKPSTMAQLPAFEIKKSVVKALTSPAAAASSGAAPEELVVDAGWSLYDEDAELQRQLCCDPSVPVAAVAECGVGKDLRPWFRATTLGDARTGFGTFATYPPKFTVANHNADENLLKAAEFRSRCRVPAISFVHLGTGAVVGRCSQPQLRKDEAARFQDAALCLSLLNPYTEITSTPRLVGAVRTRDDSPGPGKRGQHVDASATAGSAPVVVAPPPSLVDDDDSWGAPKTAPAPAPQKEEESPVAQSLAQTQRILHVIDLRPKAAATGNMAMGGGYESGMYYERCRVVFAGIDNIHGVVASWNKLRAIVASFSGTANRSKAEFFQQFEASGWLGHIQKMLLAGESIADHLAKGESVLTHCTDGWDRTSQATSVAMLLTDPYFRTVRGFCVLIEREFCSFGHKFAERMGHELPGETTGTGHISGGASDVDSQQNVSHHKKHKSPIFIQWLDGIYQLWRQFPTRFEFTPEFLEFLGVHVFSCYFGTFIGNCARERVLEGLHVRTHSLWSEVERLCAAERAGAAPMRFVNTLYTPAAEADVVFRRKNLGVDRLVPSLSAKRLVFWESQYFKYDSDRWSLDAGFDSPTALLSRMGLPNPKVGADAAAQDITSGLWAAAVKRRPTAVVEHERILTERDAAVLRKGDARTAVDLVAVDTKAKSCWICHDKFGMFRSSTACGMCRRLHCSKCIKAVGSSRMCESCCAVMENGD